MILDSRCLAGLLVLCSLLPLRAEDDVVPLEEEAVDPKLAKIVLVAGKQAGTVEHQYWAGTVIMAKLLRQTPGVHVSIVRGGWPQNIAIFDNARAIVLYLEGGEGGTTHPLSEVGRFEILQQALAKGAGLVTFHKAGLVPGALGEKMIGLQGAHYDFKTSSKGHWNVAFPKFPEHPITRGMKPFTLNDGYCIGLNFPPDMKGITPLLYAPKAAGTATISADSTTSSKDLTAWTYEREGQGRAFCFTGLHSHRYFAEESICKFVVNGILWAARLDVPAEGAPVSLDAAELEKNVEAVAPKK